MANINTVTLAGRLTNDSTLRQTKTGMGVLGFSIAVNDRVKQGNQYVDKPYFFNCTVFGKRANSIAQYLVKGTKVMLSGKLTQDKYTNKNGRTVDTVNIIVNEIEFNNMNNTGYKQQQNNNGVDPNKPVAAPVYEQTEQDIPF